ncbi:MAG: NAD(P)-dependent oxidoreductase [Candidatus Omnitrophica bacterium]|nr:NAD(P)-dependent oxidoreductase [Candidatus Omnitrophota bacterium]
MRLLITGYPGWLTARFLETMGQFPGAPLAIRLLAHPGATVEGAGSHELVRGDLGDRASLAAATRGIDAVFHAAGVIHVKRISDFYRVNRDGTRRLLEACLENGVRKFVHVSSNAAQGFSRDSNDVLTESDPCRPENDYGRSKLAGEEVVREFQRTGKIETVILRPSMFYGPPVPPRHLEIFRRIRRGRFPVFGTGEYARSVTYIDHMVQAVHLALNSPRASGQTYNIMDDETPTLNQVLLTLAEKLGVKLKIVHLPRACSVAAEKLDRVLSACGIYWMLPHIVGEAHRHIVYSTRKAKEEIGYRPTVNYREGYERTIRWCRERGVLE